MLRFCPARLHVSRWLAICPAAARLLLSGKHMWSLASSSVICEEVWGHLKWKVTGAEIVADAGFWTWAPAYASLGALLRRIKVTYTRPGRSRRPISESLEEREVHEGIINQMLALPLSGMRPNRRPLFVFGGCFRGIKGPLLSLKMVNRLSRGLHLYMFAIIFSSSSICDKTFEIIFLWKLHFQK